MSAWFLSRRIREAMRDGELAPCRDIPNGSFRVSNPTLGLAKGTRRGPRESDARFGN
jgi:hypothetical protein